MNNESIELDIFFKECIKSFIKTYYIIKNY